MEHNVLMLRVRCPYCDYRPRNPLGDNGQDLGEHLGKAHRLVFDGKKLLADGFNSGAVALAESIIIGKVMPG